MNKPKHLIHKILDNDDGHYEKIGSALLDLWNRHVETGGIEERATEFYQSMTYDFRTTVMKYVDGSNLLRD